MKPINFDGATKVLQRPATMTDAECGSLPVWSDGKQCVSCWKPSLTERLMILFRGKVYLGIMSGSTQSPCFVTGENPFDEKKRSFLALVWKWVVSFFVMFWQCAKQADKRSHFVCGFILSLLFGSVFIPVVGLAVGMCAAALKEWWDSRGHGTVEFMDFFFSAIGAAVALPLSYLFNWLFF